MKAQRHLGLLGGHRGQNWNCKQIPRAGMGRVLLPPDGAPAPPLTTAVTRKWFLQPE